MIDSTPTSLAHRLDREGSPGGQAGCSLLIGLLLGAIAAALIGYARTYPEADGTVAMYAVGGFLAPLALVLVYSGIHQLFAMKTPEPTVEMSEPVLTCGRETRFLFRQPGPASLESLRANLVGEETWSVTRGSGDSSRTSHESRYLGTFNFFDSGPQQIDAHQPFEALVTFLVPSDIPPSGRNAEGHQVAWKIEIWGKVRRRADFQHPYRVEVREAS